MLKFISALFSTPKRATTATVSVGVLAATAAFVGPWEGLRTDAYIDIAGVPTVCYGETRGVEMGDSYTPEQCRTMLEAALATYRDGVVACIPGLPDQPEGVQVAVVSWTYNVGIGAACRSTLTRLANADDWHGACNQLPRWNRGGGRVIQGLTNRRAAERTVCMEALQ